ncbi:hypothetical protein EV702DRAFT_1041126 [Suillus placidus]|uniref:Uncharacterized protein n=1 Tax=Suillus placidus TaxID=48579 RepID=A0A9P7D8K3_9AGAM|nr:hypothetical protein EV702DRAFT_1041126 [Suillus placidus]
MEIPKQVIGLQSWYMQPVAQHRVTAQQAHKLKNMLSIAGDEVTQAWYQYLADRTSKICNGESLLKPEIGEVQMEMRWKENSSEIRFERYGSGSGMWDMTITLSIVLASLLILMFANYGPGLARVQPQ